MKKLAKEFDKAYNQYLLDLGKKTLDLAKSLAPERSGNLRNSARLIQDKDIGWSVVFEAPYASDIHDGSKAYHSQRNYTMNVKSHKRRHANGKVSTVRSHKKKYKNFEGPQQVEPNKWRIVATGEGTQGSEFLTKAWQQVRGSVRDKTLKNALPDKLSSETIK